MGIVNATPDSFSDGGALLNAEAGADHAERLAAQGADMLDIGGESTRPGAQRVSAQEQIARVVPIIERLRARGCSSPISVDTTLSSVARAALDAGADAVNDVSAGSDDPAMLDLVAARGCGLVLMHRLRPPDADSYSHAYAREPEYPGGVVRAVTGFLRGRIEAARARGVSVGAIVADPGLGFGKSVAQNFELMASLGAMQRSLGVPVLAGASRKSFLGAVSGRADPSKRDAESVGAAAAMLTRGVRLFRVHAVEAHRRALDAAWRVMAGDRAGRPGE